MNKKKASEAPKTPETKKKSEPRQLGAKPKQDDEVSGGRRSPIEGFRSPIDKLAQSTAGSAGPPTPLEAAAPPPQPPLPDGVTQPLSPPPGSVTQPPPPGGDTQPLPPPPGGVNQPPPPPPETDVPRQLYVLGTGTPASRPSSILSKQTSDPRYQNSQYQQYPNYSRQASEQDYQDIQRRQTANYNEQGSELRYQDIQRRQTYNEQRSVPRYQDNQNRPSSYYRGQAFEPMYQETQRRPTSNYNEQTIEPRYQDIQHRPSQNYNDEYSPKPKYEEGFRKHFSSSAPPKLKSMSSRSDEEIDVTIEQPLRSHGSSVSRELRQIKNIKHMVRELMMKTEPCDWIRKDARSERCDDIQSKDDKRMCPKRNRSFVKSTCSETILCNVIGKDKCGSKIYECVDMSTTKNGMEKTSSDCLVKKKKKFEEIASCKTKKKACGHKSRTKNKNIILECVEVSSDSC